MTRFFRSFGSMVAFAAAACLAVASTTYERVTAACTVAYRFACDIVTGGLKLAARTEGDGLGRPAVLLVQARAFVLRLAKRDRPHLTPGWRMCPST